MQRGCYISWLNELCNHITTANDILHSSVTRWCKLTDVATGSWEDKNIRTYLYINIWYSYIRLSAVSPFYCNANILHKITTALHSVVLGSERRHGIWSFQQIMVSLRLVLHALVAVICVSSAVLLGSWIEMSNLLVVTLIPAWISNHMPSKVWDEITYPFLNFSGCTVEV